MPGAIANSISVDYRSLNMSGADWGIALDWARSLGFRGTVEVYTDEFSNVIWNIELNPGPITAGVGEVLVWDGTRMESMTQELFNTKYTPS